MMLKQNELPTMETVQDAGHDRSTSNSDMPFVSSPARAAADADDRADPAVRDALDVLPERRDLRYSLAVHRWAWAVAFTTFPLIFVGGLVTTHDAGMAVPDWPNTFGHNMFLYPWYSWLVGPFDLFVEHGHRMLGSIVGILTIGLVVSVWRNDRRGWMKFWSLAVLLAVVAQGTLGGFRVTMAERTFAMIHGVTGPMFFAIAVATCVLTSRWWLDLATKTVKPQDSRHREGTSPAQSAIVVDGSESAGSKISASERAVAEPLRIFSLRGIAISALPFLAVLQLTIGAQMRHVAVTGSPQGFVGLVHTHLALAILLTLGILFVAGGVHYGLWTRATRLKRPASALVLLVICQVLLGCAAWVANYALPWQSSLAWFSEYTIAAKGFWESWIVTGHQATGSLIIGAATVLAVRLWRHAYLARMGTLTS
jgi:cytochrome c oxidase assembly protein subunit 15